MLSILATPLGNLGDISQRALETLRVCDLILCEDTRVTSKLLAAFSIQKPLKRFDAHADPALLHKLVEELTSGKHLALVTDAGTPCISDPGFLLIAQAAAKGIPITPIPGPSAVTTALSVSGFPADRFFFAGFPPQKKRRTAFFDDLCARAETLVLYESPHRIVKTLEALSALMPTRKACVLRELTKLHETMHRGTVSEVTAAVKTGTIKGEFVIVLGPI